MSIRGAARANCVGGRTTYLEAGLAAEAGGLGAEAAEAAANALAANMVASKTAITLVIFNFLELEFSRTFFMHEGPLITAQPGRGLTQSKIFSPVRSVDMRNTNFNKFVLTYKILPAVRYNEHPTQHPHRNYSPIPQMLAPRYTGA